MLRGFAANPVDLWTPAGAMRSPVRCAFCEQTNLTWLDDGTPVCGHHYLHSQRRTAGAPPPPPRPRVRLSPGAAQLLREAAE